MPTDPLTPAAEAFLGKWSGCHLGRTARADLAALLAAVNGGDPATCLVGIGP